MVKDCDICGSDRKSVQLCPRLGLYKALCPVCDEKEYEREFPPEIYVKIIEEFTKRINVLKNERLDFVKNYQINPEEALDKYKDF